MSHQGKDGMYFSVIPGRDGQRDGCLAVGVSDTSPASDNCQCSQAAPKYRIPRREAGIVSDKPRETQMIPLTGSPKRCRDMAGTPLPERKRLARYFHHTVFRSQTAKILSVFCTQNEAAATLSFTALTFWIPAEVYAQQSCSSGAAANMPLALP